MSSSKPKNPPTYGITGAISTAEPTDHDLKLSTDLFKTLEDFGLFESKEEAQT
eukprot:Pgem_evm1s14418